MKKALIPAVLLLILATAACGKTQPTDSKPVGEPDAPSFDQSVIAQFNDCLRKDEVLDDIKNVDLYHEYDLTGLHSEKTWNEEDGTAIVTYFNDQNEAVYVFYEDYGEECFERVLRSVSGKELTVRYNSDGENNVTINCDDYQVDLFALDKTQMYGAQTVCVTVKKPTRCKLPEELSCYYEHGECTEVFAYWFDDDGYHCYQGWLDDSDGGKLCEDDQLLYERIPDAPETDGEMFTDQAIGYMPEFVVGKHRLCYTGSADDPQWYLETDFIMTFNSEKEADSFREKYSLAPSEPQGNEDECITLRTGVKTLHIAKDCEGLERLMIITEINDPYYYAISLNENGEIDQIVPGIFSYY